MRFFVWKRIYDLDFPDQVYIERIMPIKSRLFGLYVHRIFRPDYAKCEHDHPWPFITIILRGGYEEEINGKTFIRRPGYIGYRPRNFQHRITRLLKGPALTLVLRGPDHLDWGFKTVHGHLPWDDWIHLDGGERVLWCDDRVDEAQKPAPGSYDNPALNRWLS